MKNSLRVFAVAALSAATFAVLPAHGANPAVDGTNGPNGQTNNVATTQPAAQAASEADIRSVRKTLAKVTDYAVSKNSFDDVVSYLNQADRDRIGRDKNIKWDDLDQAAAQLQQDWKDKYNQDFKIKEPGNVFAAIPIYQGDIPDPNRPTAGNNGASDNPNAMGANGTTNNPQMTTPPDKNPAPGSPAAINQANQANQGNPTPAATPDQANPANNPPMAADGSNNNPQSNRVTENLVTVQFPVMGDMPAVNVHLSNEGTITRSWKIDLPQTLDAQRLHDNLLHRLTMLHDQRANWPADANDAYRTVSQSVFIALYDIDNPTHQPSVSSLGQ